MLCRTLGCVCFLFNCIITLGCWKPLNLQNMCIKPIVSFLDLLSLPQLKKLIGSQMYIKYTFGFKKSSKYVLEFDKKMSFSNLMFRSFIIYMTKFYIKGNILANSSTLLFSHFVFILYMDKLTWNFYKFIFTKPSWEQIDVLWLMLRFLLFVKDLSLISYGPVWLSIITFKPQKLNSSKFLYHC